MRRSAFYLVISIQVLSKGARAEDVYNFYFQKPLSPNSATQKEQPPVTAAQAPAANPAAETESYLKLSIGAGSSDSALGHMTGTLISIGYNFNRYVGINASALFQANLTKTTEYMGSPNENKYDIGVNFNPFTVKAFGHNFLELAILIGATNTHVLETWGYEDNVPAISQEHATYLGIGGNINFTDNFGINVFHKKTAKEFLHGSDRRQKFEYFGATLSWKI